MVRMESRLAPPKTTSLNTKVRNIKNISLFQYHLKFYPQFLIVLFLNVDGFLTKNLGRDGSSCSKFMKDKLHCFV